ncbi:tetratricopeptide repeat protein [Flavihumibacter rivuli]|uniref:tetratricopeptide repeat protein n=1 Tax=Flavihumibacter rivuli TaxID=2838156 RepID=UPI001BDEE4A1|nr:tetratricopeptide repeat protein [Flavihumibacter rivuli]ULQ57255.1 tetratricopeptide repeat protein [Flavihumibacter rivuli]
MKFLFRIVVAGLIGFSIACGNDEKSAQASTDAENILSQPPYAIITDSIASNSKDASLYYRRAELLTQNGIYDLATADIEKAWTIQPTEEIAEARVSLLFLMGQGEKAVQILEQLVKQYPANTNFKRRLGEALVQSGKNIEALASFDKMIAADSLDFEAWYEKGLLQLQSGDTSAAISSLERSLKIQPLQLTSLSLANVYAEKKNPRAIELCDQVIARDSAGELIDPHFIKGVYYSNTKNFTKALEAFDQVIRIDWKFEQSYIEKGIIYFDQKNLDEALKQFKLASTVSNTFPDAYYWQGRCYEQLGKKEEALNNYARAYALDKDFKEAVEAAARLKGK